MPVIAGNRETPNASSINIEDIDFDTEEGIQSLRRKFDVEYKTLAIIKEELLRSASGQYVVIQGQMYEVRPTIEEALRFGHSSFPSGLFFVGKIDPIQLEWYLAA